VNRRGRSAVVGLWTVLATLVLLCGLLAFTPSMWGWGLNLLRFVPAAPGWALWSLAALALIPGVSRALLPGFARAGDLVLRAPIRTLLLPALGFAALLWALPDRVWFTGDFIGRNTTAAWGNNFAAAFPENLPFDNLLHSSLPRLLGRLPGLDVHSGLRILGALEGAALLLLSVRFVRLAAGGGVEAIAGLAILIAGGYLTMFTGYAKSASELCVITLLVGIAALEVARGEAGLPLAIVATAAGLALHRAAIVLVPIVAVLGAIAWRSEPGRMAWRRPALLAAVAVLVGVLVFTGPQIVSIIFGYDLSHHFASPVIAARGGLVRSMFAGLRAIDLVNATLVLSPLAAAIPILGAFRGDRSDRALEVAVLAGIALCHVGAALLMHPQQGLFRDWDVLVATGVTLSMLAAWLVMERLRATPGAAWLGVASTLVVLAMTAQWLLHQSNIGEGLKRARAFIEESPRRTDAELGNVWLYIGDRTAQLQDWGASANALSRAARYQPSSTVFVHWGVAAMQAGDAASAREAWRGLTERQPAEPMGWRELALIDLGLGNHAEAIVAARELVRLAPDDTSATALLRRAEASAPNPFH